MENIREFRVVLDMGSALASETLPFSTIASALAELNGVRYLRCNGGRVMARNHPEAVQEYLALPPSKRGSPRIHPEE